MVYFQNTSPLNIDTSGNKKIFIEIKQENIDNGIINAEDGSYIGVIKSAASYPAKNFVSLASVTGGTITDERKFIGKKIPDIRGENRKPKGYNHKTFYGPEFVQSSVVGITDSGVEWINLHTYCPWDSTNKDYYTQTAITAYGNPGIWIRKARNAENWGDWQRIFPISATTLDINGLAEISQPTNNYDFFLVKEWR